MAKNLNRYAKKNYPKANTVAEVKAALEKPDIALQYRKNLRGNFDFYIDTIEMGQKSAFTVFASYQIMDMINKHIPIGQRHYLMDGTFNVTPVGFYQLLVIHIMFKNDVSVVLAFRYVYASLVLFSH